MLHQDTHGCKAAQCNRQGLRKVKEKHLHVQAICDYMRHTVLTDIVQPTDHAAHPYLNDD
jgi:hypothetical protein